MKDAKGWFARAALIVIAAVLAILQEVVDDHKQQR